MKIKKIYQGELPENKILNAQSTSQTDTYSCEYINNMSFGGSGENVDELPIGTRVEFNGETIPDGWEEVEESEKNIITAYTTQTLDIGENEIISFDSSNIIGYKFTIEDGKIKIGKNVKKVKISGQIWYYAYDTTRQWFYLKQNDNMINTNIAMLNKSYGVMNFNEKIIDVVEGDVIYFELVDLEGTGTIGINYGSSIKNMTFMTIEEVSNVVNSVVEENKYNLITNGDAIKAGYTIDGKDVYVKRIKVNSMPNNATIEVDSGISSEYEIDYYTGVFANNNKYTMPLPMEGTNFIRAGLDGRLTTYMLQISSNSDRTSWTGTFNIFYY